MNKIHEQLLNKIHERVLQKNTASVTSGEKDLWTTAVWWKRFMNGSVDIFFFMNGGGPDEKSQPSSLTTDNIFYIYIKKVSRK